MIGVKVYWYDDEKTMLYYVADQNWRWESFYEVMSQIQTLTEQKQDPFYLIADFTRLHSLPAQALIHFRYLSDQIPPNMSTVAMIGVSPIIRRLYGSFARVYSKITVILDMRFVDSLDEAVALLKDERQRNRRL
jgi:hypothetical protein